MVLSFEKFPCIGASCFVLLLLGCTQVKYDNPYDPDGINYNPNAFVRYSSSVPSSSSSIEPSSSSEAKSSSSVVPSSSSSAESSSSSETESSSSTAPSSSSVEPSCSSALQSSSSVALSSSSNSSSSSSSFRSSSSLIPSSSSFVHIGKGNNISNYRTVVIGTQTWMAENLDYVVEGSKCYNNDPTRCNEYGSLYNWSTAMNLSLNCNSSTCSSQIQSKHRGICPSGWHIPNQAEWETLSSYVKSNSNSCSNCDAQLLKATSGWSSGGNGTDQYEFSALPGGIGFSDGSFGYFGLRGNWWSANEDSSNYAYHRVMYDTGVRIDWASYYKSSLFSVRCLKD